MLINGKHIFPHAYYRAYEKIVEENEQKALRLERIAQIIESKKLYYSGKDVVPRLVDMRNSILLELKMKMGALFLRLKWILFA